MNEITTTETGGINTAQTGLSIFDSGAFEKMLLIAQSVAASPLIPATLQGKTPEETAANCLLVVEQSSRWGLSPFAVMQCASVIHGRLMWEGKLVSAVIDAQLGIRLDYRFSGSGEKRKVEVAGKFADEVEERTIVGDVAQWKTSGKGSPWSDPRNYDRQLSYRGAREWARRHASAVMLGVITDDDQYDAPQQPTERNVTPPKEEEPKVFLSDDQLAELVEMFDELQYEDSRITNAAKWASENESDILADLTTDQASKLAIHLTQTIDKLRKKEQEEVNREQAEMELAPGAA